MSRIIGVSIKILIIFIEICIIGTGAALATRAWDPVWSPFRPSPEKVILQAWNQLKEIKSQNFDAELAISGRRVEYAGRSGNFNINFKAAGGVDVSDKNNVLSVMTSSATLWANDEMENQYNFSIAGETRQMSKVFYIKITKLDLGNFNMFLMMFGIDTSKFKDQWIKLDLNDTAYVRQTEQEKNLKEALDEITKILLDRKVYNISQLLDNQGMEGKEYHYKVSLDREKFMAATPEIFNALKKYSEKSGQAQTDEYNLENLKKDVNNFFDKVGEISFDIFIGKQDNFFHKAQFVKSFDINKFNSQYSGTIQINYKIEESGINKPVEVSAPAEYKNLQDLFPQPNALPIKAKASSI